MCYYVLCWLTSCDYVTLGHSDHLGTGALPRVSLWYRDLSIVTEIKGRSNHFNKSQGLQDNGYKQSTAEANMYDTL